MTWSSCRPLKRGFRTAWIWRISVSPKARMSFICHIHNYTEYNEEWNVFSAFNPSKCTHLEQWAADCAAPGEQSWTSCRSRDLNPQPWVTSGFKSNALSIRPTTAQSTAHQELSVSRVPCASWCWDWLISHTHRSASLRTHTHIHTHSAHTHYKHWKTQVHHPLDKHH